MATLPASAPTSCPAYPFTPPTRASTAGSIRLDRKSTRLNSSHLGISYAVFCLEKKNTQFNAGLHLLGPAPPHNAAAAPPRRVAANERMVKPGRRTPLSLAHSLTCPSECRCPPSSPPSLSRGQRPAL